MRLSAWCLALLLAGCGGRLVDESGRGADASNPEPLADARADGATPPSTSECPPVAPLRGGSCDVARTCSYPDPSCGGSLDATCVGGRWVLRDCGDYCPQPSVTVGAACSGTPSCTYWSADRCMPCRCVDGRWSCDAAGSCATPRSACVDGAACGAAGDGCVQGKCLSICRCGFDLAYHCYSHPC